MADIHETTLGATFDVMIRKLHDPSWPVRADAIRWLMRFASNVRTTVENVAGGNGDEVFLPTEAASGGLVRLVFFIAGAVIGAIVGVVL